MNDKNKPKWWESRSHIYWAILFVGCCVTAAIRECA